uniref:Uncharacterized protein n=1 Tax=viral metagenome TaxID=1070528 RepID=A0A6M3XQD9_9ZZZZ
MNYVKRLKSTLRPRPAPAQPEPYKAAETRKVEEPVKQIDNTFAKK